MTTVLPSTILSFNASMSPTLKILATAASSLITTQKPTAAPPSIYWKVRVAMEKVYLGATVIDLIFLIVFLYNFLKPKSSLRSPFYILIFISIVIRAITFGVRYHKFDVAVCEHWYNVTWEIWYGFQMLWQGIIVLAVAANRATAIAMPFKHLKVCFKN